MWWDGKEKKSWGKERETEIDREREKERGRERQSKWERQSNWERDGERVGERERERRERERRTNGQSIKRNRTNIIDYVYWCTNTYYTILYYTVIYYNILYCTILYYTALYYTILHYTILYYTILYYILPVYLISNSSSTARHFDFFPTTIHNSNPIISVVVVQYRGDTKTKRMVLTKFFRIKYIKMNSKEAWKKQKQFYLWTVQCNTVQYRY